MSPSIPFSFSVRVCWGDFFAWATLPAVIGCYIGNPFFGQRQPWVDDILVIGQKNGRFPSNALE